MGEYVIKLPDVGEGVAEAELVAWHIKVGDLVREDTVLAEVMTDKATVEIPSPADGEILWLGATVGDAIAVGSDLIRLKVEGEIVASSAEPRLSQVPPAKSAAAAKPTLPASTARPPAEPPQKLSRPSTSTSHPPTAAQRRSLVGAPRAAGERPLASPAVRLRAKDAGVDLRQVHGTDPAGRISHEDLDAFIARGPQLARPASLQEKDEVHDIRVIGLRRRIAERMTLANTRIPHITYVEEIDVSALEELRASLNQQKPSERPRLTLLPFLMAAMVKAIASQPAVNALFDDEAGIIHQHAGVHIGIATQTPNGLVVPVVRHAEARDLWECASEVSRLAESARAGLASREELGGSTITITSLGALGGIVTTPIINYPELAIIGVNKVMVRPVWDGTGFRPRKMMNLSSSFDHRVIDGWDAATFVQRLKTLIETPATIFMEG